MWYFSPQYFNPSLDLFRILVEEIYQIATADEVFISQL